MSSVVSICNLALGNIAKPEIQSIDEASAEAKACKQYYGHVLGVALESYPWRFARRTEAMAEVANIKPKRWGFAYQRPTGCRKALMVTDDRFAEYDKDDPAPPPYDIEGDIIYCNIPAAYLIFTAQIDDPTKYTFLFIEALSWHLAVRLAMPLTRDPKIRADAYQLAVQTTGQAGVADANEVREVDDAPSRAIEAR